MTSLPRGIDIGWSGWRRQWKEGTKLEWYYNMKFALDGSQAIFVRRNGLLRMWQATGQGNRYLYFGLTLSERLVNKFWYPPQPELYTATHLSQILGKGQKIARPGTVHKRPATGRQPAGKVRKVAMKSRVILCCGKEQRKRWITGDSLGQ